MTDVPTPPADDVPPTQSGEHATDLLIPIHDGMTTPWALAERVRRSPDGGLIARTSPLGRRWREMSASAFRTQVREVAAGLVARGLEPGDTIVCNYLGQIWGGQVFDNSFDRGQPLSFQIGVGMVIRGWDEGLVGQRVGSRVLLSIPSELGYGSRGVPQAGIKGGDTLVFVTEILAVL